MNWSVELGVLISIIFFLYSILCYIKKDIFFTIRRDNRFLIINKDKYLKLQLKINLISFTCLMILSFMNRYSKINITYIIYFNLIFWTFNYILKRITLLKKYAELLEKSGQ
ncbi:hypothetical protein psyc5s11_53640 [Clostridium gelidum]|uniref:DUF4181 domain-containing protein n=1 Tax=Clostridium gelidum TaxID=704125 RepID=A0ABM7TBH4_9CLOT|nr:hypothetical protein [Clostridium gelidum]BCZ49297.1 hypothetical protein psyc5s11_53640 [Clostridium gelidum]